MPGNYHADYIERNRQSISYKHVLNFILDSLQNIEYRESLQALKHRIKKRFKRYNLLGLPKQWLPLYRYKDKYYVYEPCDGGALDRKRITDSTMVYWGFEPYLEVLQQVKKLNHHTWYLESYPKGIDSTTSRLTIHIIDPKNGIAVWEDTSEPSKYRYQLCVAKEKAANFDMVVDYCPDVRSSEFMFDKIDYAALLKGK